LGVAELDLLLDTHRLRLNPILRHVHEAADVARKFLDEQA
jgi:hypothetical protein